ncbi:MAG TPA: maleylpyruvate isomerase family mycothiol-dependent enzyme [Acidimicrobiia bacterium]|jgi:uncharacterized protein (TIGR03083 family)
MGNNRVAALRAERQAVLDFFGTLTPEEWDAPSGCPGWTVKNVLSHMSAAFHGCFTPWFISLLRTDNLERSNDGDVEKRSGWAPEKVLSEYRSWSARYLTIQPVMKGTGLNHVKIRLGDLGKYPMGIIPAALTFDHHTHLRHDVAGALGKTPPPTDAARMAVALEWMMAGIPQMCRASMSGIERPVDITLNGPGGGTWGLSPTPGGIMDLHPGGAPGASALVIGAASEFVLWGTTRESWRDHEVKVDGDIDLGERFLDALKVV